ncbi:hypothetical protein ACFLZK_01180 [Patescibacteria group bacterium]
MKSYKWTSGTILFEGLTVFMDDNDVPTLCRLVKRHFETEETSSPYRVQLLMECLLENMSHYKGARVNVDKSRIVKLFANNESQVLLFQSSPSVFMDDGLPQTYFRGRCVTNPKLRSDELANIYIMMVDDGQKCVINYNRYSEGDLITRTVDHIQTLA